EPDGEYRVVVEAEGFQGERSGWLPVGNTRPLAFPDLTLQRLRVVQGRGLDRQGETAGRGRGGFSAYRPPATTPTHATGRFRLPDVLDGAGFLFVEKAGFRFHGQAARAASAIEVVLVSRKEPSDKALTTLPPALGKKERHVLAGQILQPVVNKL